MPDPESEKTPFEAAFCACEKPYATIQKAVDEIPNLITKHYTISVSSDTYNEQVDIFNKVCLGPDASLTIEGDTSTPSNVVVTGSAKGFHVVGSSNIIILGVETNGCTNGFEIVDSDRCYVGYCEAKNNSAYGIMIGQSSEVTVTEVVCEDNSVGIISRDNAYCYVTNSHFNSNDDYGITCTGSGYVLAQSNECSDNEYGIYCEGRGYMDMKNNYSNSANQKNGVRAIYGATINDFTTNPTYPDPGQGYAPVLGVKTGLVYSR